MKCKSTLETTALYAKVSTRTIHAVTGPLDRLMALMEGKTPPEYGVRTSIEGADIFHAAGPAYRAAHAGHLSRAQLKVMSAIVGLADELGKEALPHTGLIHARSGPNRFIIHPIHQMPGPKTSILSEATSASTCSEIEPPPLWTNLLPTRVITKVS